MSEPAGAVRYCVGMTIDKSELTNAGFAVGASDAERDALAALFSIEEHPVGTALIVEGGDSNKFYVLLDGHVTVHREGVHLADLGSGDCFGEAGVLTLEERNATVITTTPVRVAAAMGWDLRSLVESHEGLAAKITG